ncbi:MAG: hypothetical protein K0B02_03950 [DPANN group archaeon]|nr:hypothetical protein [DPANN group archaeon]
MKLGTKTLEYFLLVCLAIIVVLNFMLLTGAMLSGIDNTDLLNMFVLLILGTQFVITIILLRIYEQLSTKKH